jgi:hypothetical protein
MGMEMENHYRRLFVHPHVVCCSEHTVIIHQKMQQPQPAIQHVAEMVTAPHIAANCAYFHKHSWWA